MVGNEQQVFKTLQGCVHWLQSSHSCSRVKICTRQEPTQAEHSNWENFTPEHFAGCKQQSGWVILIRALIPLFTSRLHRHPQPTHTVCTTSKWAARAHRNISNSFRTFIQDLWNHVIINNIMGWAKNCLLKVVAAEMLKDKARIWQKSTAGSDALNTPPYFEICFASSN